MTQYLPYARHCLAILSVFLTLDAYGQGSNPERSAGTTVEIEARVRLLGSPRFADRQQALKWLWRQGWEAEPALQNALQNSDEEIRRRARLLLDDFRYGILPDTSDELIALIRSFRTAVMPRKLTLAREFVRHHHFDALERVLALEPQPELRRILLFQVFHQQEAVAYYLPGSQLERLIDVVGRDQQPRWRSVLQAQLFAIDGVIDGLLEHNQLRRLEHLLAEHGDDPDLRGELSTQFFASPNSLSKLVEGGQLLFLFELLEHNPNDLTRAKGLANLLGAPNAIEHLVAQERLESVFHFARRNLEDAGRIAFYRTTVQNSRVCQPLLQQIGFDELIKLADTIDDPRRRGEFFGALMGSMAIRQHLGDARYPSIAMQLARDQDEAPVFEAYMSSLFSRTAYPLLRDQRFREQLWDLMQTAAGQAWRADALLQMLRLTAQHSPLRTRDDSRWLIQFLHSEASDSQREALLTQILQRHSAILGGLVKYQHFDAMLKLVSQTPESQRPLMTARFLAHGNVLEHLRSSERTGLLLRSAKQETDPAARQAYLRELFQHATAMQAIVEEGYFSDFFKLVLAEPAPAQRSLLFVSFARSAAICQKLQADGKLGLLLEFATEHRYREAQSEFLQQLFGRNAAFETLLQEGHYEFLHQLARDQTQPQIRSALLAAFYAHPQVIARLVAEDSVDVVLEFAGERIDDKLRRSTLLALFRDQKAIPKLISGRHFEDVVALSKLESNRAQRASILGAFLATKDVLQDLLDRDEISKLFHVFDQESDDFARRELIRLIVAKHDLVQLLVENGHLDNLLDAIGSQLTPESRGYLLPILYGQPAVMKRLEEDAHFGKLIHLLASLDSPKDCHRILQQFATKPDIIKLFLARDRFEWLLDLEERSRRPSLINSRLFHIQLLVNAQSLPALIQANKVDHLLGLLFHEGDETSLRTFFQRLLANEAALSVFIQHGFLGDLLALGDRMEDACQRSWARGVVMLSPHAVEPLATAGMLDRILDDAVGCSDSSLTQSFLRRLFQHSIVIERLLERGYFGRLSQLAEGQVDNNARLVLLSALYGQPSVLKEIASTDRFETILGFMSDELTPDQRRGLLQRVTADHDFAVRLVEQGHFLRLIGLIREEPRHRKSMLEPLLRNAVGLEQLLKRSEVNVFFSKLKEWQDSRFSMEVVAAWVGEDDILKRLLICGYRDALLSLNLNLQADNRTGELVATITLHPQSLAELQSQQRIESLLALAADLTAEAPRQTFIEKLLHQTETMQQLINRDQFQMLLTLITKMNASLNRSMLLSKLIRSDATADYVAKKDRAEMLLQELTRYLSDQSLLNDLLVPMCRSEAIMTAMIQQQQFDALLTLGDSISDASQRRRFWGSLLLSAKAIDQLKHRGRFDTIFSTVLNHTSARENIAVLERLIFTDTSLRTHMDLGHLPNLRESVGRIDDPESRNLLLEKLESQSPPTDPDAPAPKG